MRIQTRGIKLKVDPGLKSKDRKSGILYSRDWQDLWATVWEFVKDG